MSEDRIDDSLDLTNLTNPAVQRLQTVEFAGFLTREDSDSLYVADVQGTWVIRREDVAFLEDWEQSSGAIAPEFMNRSGRPVRVGIKEGALIQEIRPWRVEQQHSGLTGSQVRQAIDEIFTLGGAPLPIGERTAIGEKRLAELERRFQRRLGWDPDSVPETHSPTGTYVLRDGYCDADHAL